MWLGGDERTDEVPKNEFEKRFPVGLDKVYVPMKDVRAAFYGILTLPGIQAPVEWGDRLRPEFKDKLVLTYPNDDDAVLYAFDLITHLKQNPRWVSGTRSPDTIMKAKNSTRAASFTSDGLFPTSNIKISHPVKGSFVTWFQLAAILKDEPQPEGAKLLHNYMLTKSDVHPPQVYPPILEMPGTNTTYFREWMSDRYRIERLGLWFKD
ncbi:hypothetical protein COCC4DRAFT_136267 [Bipolaris maydis ATCC 48331]|uniref:Uncharacterized protein n=3 Tax=Cochliobolus heterostrophus TaxID=5016 RepID=M2TWE7_COCH5|nr:uncharacterized protein COCC4DRAFT_136267 [Bipolaris maydis ATCC 48331]EMD90824.1 hypothetical protein COCHEDRAFT_1156180 [Bipolaris maydis C5]ENI06091.1 hypothetical protein COCC4DRAFT_136267 [Bipolaris maydis ATCC 48331]